MNNNTSRTFSDLFSKTKIQLEVKFDVKSDETPTIVTIENNLKSQSSSKSKEFIQSICAHPKMKEFADFYKAADGFELAVPVAPNNCIKQPLFRQFLALEIDQFTQQYFPGGRFAFTIDYNKSKSLYRNNEKWIVFAQINKGPACLTTFLEGENAGNIYFLEPEPKFNILKPIAKGYQGLLNRITSDPAAFLRLVRACVLFKKDRQMNYGFVPTKYID